MTDNNSTSDSSADEPTEYMVFGWAEAGPSCTIELDPDESIDDISDKELTDQLRYELLDRGFTWEQIDQMNIELDYVEEKTI